MLQMQHGYIVLFQLKFIYFSKKKSSKNNCF